MISLDQGGRARASARAFRVDGPAAALAESAWMLGPVAVPVAGAPSWRVVPDVHPHLIVAALPGGRIRACLVGARSRWADVDQHGRAWTVGVRLRPGAIPVLTGGPAAALTDRSLPLVDVLDDGDGRLGARLDALRSTDGPEDPGAPDHPSVRALGILLDALARRGAGASVDWKARGFLALASGRPGRPVREVADHLGVASRTLRAVGRDHLGLPPKHALRVLRIQRALALGLGPEAPVGSRVAHASGFADQAHFVRECRDLVGETPGAFHARGRD
ncbi:MAG: helix-turn-helix transcriptional regulator [Longimicrobiales bacterium]